MSKQQSELQDKLCKIIACGERLYINAGRFCQYDELCKRCTDKFNDIQSSIDAEVETRLAEHNQILYRPARTSGRTLQMFMEFQKAIEHGKTAEWHGKDYVVMNRKQYDDIQRRLAESSVIILTDELSTTPQEEK